MARDCAHPLDGADAQPETRTVALDIVGLSKSYGATHALRSVDLRLERGEIHALLGENGAGKSTLVKVLSGIVPPDAGRIAIAGVPFAPTSLMEARLAGLSTAFQELSLLPNLSVADNLMLPRLRKDRLGLAAAAANVRAAERMLAEFNAAEIDPKILVGDLSLAERQRVEIVRAFSHRPRILILDEPTAALAQPEWLFHEVERVARAGTAVLYITHRLAEVRRLCSRATVLRNGSKIDTVRLTGTSDADVFRMMVGKAPGERAQRSTAAPDTVAPAALSVRDLSGAAVDGVSFDLRPGEILGVAALEGQGQRELFRMLAGAAPVRRGTMAVCGRTVAPRSPDQALKVGIGFMPEDRKTEGIFRGIGTAENVSLSVIDQMTRLGLIERAEERRRVGAQATEVELQAGYLGRPIDALSGGNQQKALLARVLMTGAKQLVLYDPTRGVDVGTKELIYGVIRRFVDNGGSVLIYSTELDELVHLVDRCLVVYRGRVVGEVAGDDLAEATLVALASGHGEERAAAGSAAAAGTVRRRLLHLARDGTLIAALVFVALFAIYALRQPGALSLISMTNMLNNALPVALAAAGGTLVVLSRGFDLSVAGVVSLTNVLIATTVGNQPWEPATALLMVMAVGGSIGAVNGFLVAYVGLQSITTTLATMLVCSGLALLVLETPGGYVPEFIAYDLTDVVAGYVPVAALIAAGVAVIWLAIRRTDWGVALYAVGADETAAQLSGIKVQRTRFFAYCLAGVCYGLAGYMLSALTASGDPISGSFYLILVFSAIAIGGTAFTGGKGGLVGSMLGAAILTLLPMVLFSLGVRSYATGIVQGMVMILAVMVGVQAARLSPGSRA